MVNEILKWNKSINRCHFPQETQREQFIRNPFPKTDRKCTSLYLIMPTFATKTEHVTLNSDIDIDVNS